MSGLALGRCHRHGAFAEYAGNGLGLVRVADVGGSGMGIDISDLPEVDAGAPDGHFEGPGRTVHIGGGDMVAVGGKAVAEDFGQDGSAPPPGRFVTFQNHRRRASAGNKTVAVAVEGPAGLRGFVFPGREGGNAVE